ncbi:MAG: 23S rRNA (adenine(2030)-N(6))-methyltransferase RlmJ, partial [Rhizobiales bacterium]|nr:23S rRNA (adenine(2030)-N(6))-methyltransferase RlmJ [Hyphomicrobiales bacterium]
ARAMLRADDRLIGCELEPGAAAALLANLGRGKRSKAIAIDGWTALSAYVPPLERRGLVLIDPPYEKTDEFARLADALRAAHCKWPTGLYLAWYPIKSDRAGPRMLAAALQDAGIDRLLWSEMTFGATQETGRLLGSGLVLVNPPWRLDEDLDEVLPHVAAALDDGRRLKVRTHR